MTSAQKRSFTIGVSRFIIIQTPVCATAFSSKIVPDSKNIISFNHYAPLVCNNTERRQFKIPNTDQRPLLGPADDLQGLRFSPVPWIKIPSRSFSDDRNNRAQTSHYSTVRGLSRNVGKIHAEFTRLCSQRLMKDEICS